MHERMKKLQSYNLKFLPTILSFILVISLLIFLLLYQIGSISNFKLSTSEIEFLQQSSSLRRVLTNSLFLPIKLPVYLLSSLSLNNVFLRLVPAFFGGITCMMFYSILKTFHTKRIALLGSVLLATSSWFLHNARILLPNILLVFGVMTVIFLSVRLPKAKFQKSTYLLGSLLLVTCLYIPGFIWLVFGLLIFKFKRVLKVFKTAPIWLQLIVILLIISTMIPLGYSLLLGDLPVRTYLGIPLIFNPTQWLKNFVMIPIYLFARGPFDPVLNLSRLPLLDLFTTILVILGAYVYWHYRKLDQFHMLFLLGGFSIILTALNGGQWIVLLLPILYLLTAIGIGILLQQWFTVFPKNPIARSIGIALIFVSLATIVSYHTVRYYFAWPKNENTRQTFVRM